MNREERRREEKLQGAMPEARQRRWPGCARPRCIIRPAAWMTQNGLSAAAGTDAGAAGCLHGLGLLPNRRGNLRDALTAWPRHARPMRAIPSTAFNHGVVLQRAGLLPDAVDAYNRAIQLNPGTSTPHEPRERL